MIKYYVGSDVHSNNTVLGILDESGKRLLKKRLANDIEEIAEVLAPYQQAIAGVVVESTYNWYWIVDGLMARGYAVHLANVAAMTPNRGKKYTDDVDDTFALAELLQAGKLKEGHIYPREGRNMRDLLRKRMALVQERTRHILSLQGMVNRYLGRRVDGNEVKSWDEKDLHSLFPEEPVYLSAQANLSALRLLDEEVRQIEKYIAGQVESKEALELLQTIPGIGKILALVILWETGDIGRFKEVGNYVSYCRLVESKRMSNARKKGRNNRKNGNRYLSWAFGEAAVYATRYNEDLRRYYQRKASRSHRMVALRALAHKLARAAYHVMRDGQPFSLSRFLGAGEKEDGGKEPVRNVGSAPR